MLRVSIAFVLTSLLSVPLNAQTPGAGSVSGLTKDEQGAVIPGVTVTATSPDAPRVYRATTDAAGQYRFPDLPPGTYAITAELGGFATVVRPEIVVRAGLNVPLDLTMRVGGVNETVEVRVDTPLLEARNGTQAVNVSGDLLRGVPLAERREWTGALSVAPGVVTSSFGGSNLFYIRGSEASGVVILLDGADVTDASKTGVRYLQLNTDAIADIQIQTSGMHAGSPLGNGGVINIVTASGTNTPKGAAGVFLQPRQWNGSNQPGGTSTTIDQTQLDASFGGPLIVDRLWGYGAWRRTDITTGVSRTPQQLAVLQALIPGYEPLDTLNETSFWLGKITAQAAGHQIVGFYQRDVNPVLDVLAHGQHRFGQATGGTAAALRVSSVWSDRITTRLGLSYNDKRREGVDHGVDGPNIRVFNGTVPSGGRLVGNGMLASLGAPVLTRLTQPNEKLTFSLDATIYARNRTGVHDLQFGVFAQPRVQGNHIVYTNGGFTLEEQALRVPGDLASGLIPFHRQIINGPELTTFRQRTRDYAVYVQDGWQPTPRLTVSAGVRVDRITVDDEVFGVRAQRSLEVGPRFGVNYAVTADARNVARAHWVRVHDQAGLVTTTGTPSLGQRDLYDLDRDGTFETEFVTPPREGTIANRSTDPDLHQPWVQEWGAGYSRQFGGRLAAHVDVVRKRFVHRPTLIETNASYENGVFSGYVDERFNDFHVAANNRWNTPVYSSFEFSLTKQTSRIEALASYVRQWRHIDGTWQPGDPASIIQPHAFPNARGIGTSTGTATATFDTNSLSGFNMTQTVTASAQWQDHVVRTAVAYSAPWSMLLAANYTFQSGTWSGPIIARIAAPDPAFGPPTVTLSNGRVVPNPLATTLRFAYPTRGEGQLRTPGMHALNLRVGRRFTLNRVRIDAGLDVFNVTNHDADLGFEFLSNQTFNPFFGQTIDRQLPRSAQAVVRVSF